MKAFLKIPAWVIFISLMIPMFIGVGNNSVGTILSGLVFGIWIFLMGLSTRQISPTNCKFSITFFVFRVLFFTAYIVISGFYFGYNIPNMAIPFHIVAAIFIFSCLSTCATTILMAETQKEKNFYDSLSIFLLLWFFPIGIWFVQPRLNALYKLRPVI